MNISKTYITGEVDVSGDNKTTKILKTINQRKPDKKYEGDESMIGPSYLTFH